MPSWPHDVPLMCSYPCPAIYPLAKPSAPSPDSLVPTQLCLLPGSLCPGQTACPCPGLCALSGFWGPLPGLEPLSPACMTSTWSISPLPSSIVLLH